VTGLGNKTCITVTLSASASGEVLPPSLIFEGKTDRCHPQNVDAPHGGYFTHTESHWQTKTSFIDWIDRVLTVYMDRMIKKHHLPPNQVCVLILDLHYSHLAPESLAHMKGNNIIPVFIPGGCTDEMQVMDVCCNKSYKSAVKTAFREHTHDEFTRYIQTPGNEPAHFKLNMSTKALKPLMPRLVQRGIDNLLTAAMSESIRHSFQKHARLEVCRTAARVAQAKIYRGLVVPGEHLIEDEAGVRESVVPNPQTMSREEELAVDLVDQLSDSQVDEMLSAHAALDEARAVQASFDPPSLPDVRKLHRELMEPIVNDHQYYNYENGEEDDDSYVSFNYEKDDDSESESDIVADLKRSKLI
jgi:hypothetical protein